MANSNKPKLGAAAIVLGVVVGLAAGFPTVGIVATGFGMGGHDGATAFAFGIGWGVAVAVVVGFIIAAIVLLIGKGLDRLRRGRRPLSGHCPCGYDLTGNVSGVCPECGMTTR